MILIFLGTHYSFRVQHDFILVEVERLHNFNPLMQMFSAVLVIFLSAPDVYRSFPCHWILG